MGMFADKLMQRQDPYQLDMPNMNFQMDDMPNPMPQAVNHPMYEMNPMGKNQSFSQVVSAMYGQPQSHMDQAMTQLIGPALGGLGAYATGGGYGLGNHLDAQAKVDAAAAEEAQILKRQRENNPLLEKSYFEAMRQHQAHPDQSMQALTSNAVDQSMRDEAMKDINTSGDMWRHEHPLGTSQEFSDFENNAAKQKQDLLLPGEIKKYEAMYGAKAPYTSADIINRGIEARRTAALKPSEADQVFLDADGNPTTRSKAVKIIRTKSSGQRATARGFVPNDQYDVRNFLK